MNRVDASGIPKLVASLGASQMAGLGVQVSGTTTESDSLDYRVLSIHLDGRIIGYCSARKAKEIAETLRFCKVEGKRNV